MAEEELHFLSVTKLYDDRNKLLDFARKVRDCGQPDLVAAAEAVIDVVDGW